MGVKSQVVKERICLCCKKTHETTSKGLRRHFKACCAMRRNPPKTKRGGD